MNTFLQGVVLGGSVVIAKTPYCVGSRAGLFKEFLFQFCNFLVRCSVYIVCPTVSNLKLHQTLEVKKKCCN